MDKQKIIEGLKRSSPTLLSCAAGIGVIATAVLAAKAGPKAISLIGAKECEKGTKMTRLEQFQTTWKTYAPTGIVAVATVGCIFASNYLNRRNQASLMAAYATLDQTFKQYRKSATNVYGPDADLKIRADMAKENYLSADGYSLYLQEYDDEGPLHTFYEMYTKQYFTSTFGVVLNAQYHINRNLNLRGDVTLNEYLEFLGIEKVAGGDALGWDVTCFVEDYGLQPWIEFDNIYTKVEDSPDGMECFIISASFDPVPYDEEEGVFRDPQMLELELEPSEIYPSETR